MVIFSVITSTINKIKYIIKLQMVKSRTKICKKYVENIKKGVSESPKLLNKFIFYLRALIITLITTVVNVSKVI